MNIKELQKTIQTLIKLSRTNDGLSSVPFADKLIDRELIYRHAGKYHITVKGREYLREQIKTAMIAPNPGSWKDEVLTGMTSDGLQTKIQNAALPTCGMFNKVRDFESALASAIDEAEQVTKDLKINPDDIPEMIQNGTFGWCKGGHYGVFTVSNGVKASKCKRCRAAYARSKRRG